MSKDVHEIRESQFVLMYGPGSLVETTKGTRLIPEINHCLSSKRYNKDFLENNEFSDEIRMSSVIRSLTDENEDRIHLFSMPSDVSQNMNSGTGSFYTYIFPVWKICNKKHGDIGPILYNSMKSKNNNCPICGEDSSTNVRFVLACPDGHLEDIDWHYAVHGPNPKCIPNFYYWNDKGRNFSDIIITCSKCGTSIDMDTVYTKIPFKCTGRLPERQGPYFDSNRVPRAVFSSIYDKKYEACENYMSIVQKQSTSLRVPKSITLLKMPKYENPIFKVFTKPGIQYIKSNIEDSTNSNEFMHALRDIPKNDFDLVEEYIIKENCDNYENEDNDQNFNNFKNKIMDVIRGVNFSDALLEEFNLLNSEEVFKPSLFKESFIPYNFEYCGTNFLIKIAPISKLKTVTAQLSYIRLPGQDEETGNPNNKSISSGHKNEDGIWYPAYEGVGEGIFITSDKNPLDYLDNDLINKWNKIIKNIETRGRDEIKTPLFVWWHTLAHSLINSLALSCGYNSTSLNERIYINGEKAGILIYNTSPGEDSGMGGLVERARNFEIVLKNAIDSITYCSNDPLCYNENIGENRVNGAACHNCLLISETSCEHQNTLLDRHFFV